MPIYGAIYESPDGTRDFDTFHMVNESRSEVASWEEEAAEWEESEEYDQFEEPIEAEETAELEEPEKSEECEQSDEPLNSVENDYAQSDAEISTEQGNIISRGERISRRCRNRKRFFREFI